MSPQIRNYFVKIVVIPLALVGVALCLRFWPLNDLGWHIPYLTFYPAVMIAALSGGALVGLPATSFSAIVIYFWQNHLHPFPDGLANWEGMAVFMLTGLIVSTISEVMIRARSRQFVVDIESTLGYRHAQELEAERRKALESKNRFQTLFEETPVGILVAYPISWRVIEANNSALNLFGYNLEELRKMTVSDLTHPDESEPVLHQAHTVTGGGIGNSLAEKRFIRKDGRLFWSQISVTNIRDVRGNDHIVLVNLVDITDRKLREAELQEQRDLLREMSTLAKIGGWSFDPETGDGAWTKETARIHDVDPDVATSAAYGLKFFEGENRTRIEAAVKEASEHGTPYDLELQMKTAKGQHKWVRTLCHPIVEDGRVIRVRGAIQDITRRKRREAVLAESRETLSLLIEHAPVALALFDRDMLYLGASRRWYTDYGLEGQDIIGRSHYDVFPEIPERWKQIHQRGMEGETIRQDEDRFERSDGSVQWLHWIIRPWRRADGGIGGIIMFTEDITQRKHFENALHERDARFRAAVESSNDGFWLTDADGNLVDVNDAYTTLSGYSREELLNMQVVDLEAQESAQDVARHIKQIREGGHDRFETLHRRKDGTVWPAEISVTHVTSLGNLHFSFIHDITNRKQSEQQIADYVNQLELSMEGTLQVISKMVEQRDPYTAGHERRVGVIAADIAREMSWDESRCKSLELVGLVHDIGKIGVPAEILTKPGRLTALEYQVVQTHAERGYDILKDVSFSIPVAEIIYQHHERMDGSGYPRELKGDAILPEARVLGVADVLESMASHRPYRPALGIDAALQEISDYRGTHFDADVVDALIRLVREKAYRLPD